MKKLLSITIALIMTLATAGVVFADDASSNLGTSGPVKAQPNDKYADVRIYCDIYGIKMSQSTEFVKEARRVMKDRDFQCPFNKRIPQRASVKSFLGENPLMKDRYIPTSAYADIIWTDNPLTPFDHVGLYTKADRITEALPQGVKSRTVGKTMKEYPFHIYKVTTKDNGSKRYSFKTRSKVTKWCDSQLNKPYDFNFTNNKGNTAASNARFNCSELVWKSWMFQASVDLDSNGGKIVFPNDIKNSKRAQYIAGEEE